MCIPTLRKMKMVWYKWMVHQANAPSCCAYSFTTVCLIRTIVLHVQKSSFLWWERRFKSVGEPLRTCYVVDTTRKKTMFTVQNIDGTFQNWNVTNAKDTHLKTRKVKIEMLLKKKYTLEKSKIHYHQVKLFFHQVKLSFSSSQIVFFIKSSRLFHQVKLSFSSSQIVFFIKSNGRFHQVKLSFSSSQIVFLVFSSSQIVFFVFHFLNFLFRYA